jgi:DNA-binding beta-propeller fold protein YncE
MASRAGARRLLGGRTTAFVALVALVALGASTAACAPSVAESPPAGSPAAAHSAPASSTPSSPAPVPTGTSGPPGQALGTRLRATLSVDGAPCALAASADAVWVTSYRTGRIDRIDPSTNQVTKRIELVGQPCGIALAPDGRIWVAELSRGRVVGLDPGTGTVVHEIGHLGPQLWDLKAGFGSIWVTDRDKHVLLRIAPDTGTVVARIPVGPRAAGIAVLRDAVWVADDSDGTIRRVDPMTNASTVTATLPGGGVSWFADDGRQGLIASQRLAAKAVDVDPATGAPGATIGGWRQPLDGTIVGGVLWLPDGQSGTVLTADAALSGPITAFILPGAKMPFVAEPAFGDVWVLDFGGTTIWRIAG